LQSENGLAFDFRIGYKNNSFQTMLSPYAYYFYNYIFLKPSGVFSILPDGGQIYQYSQSKALLTGFEWKFEDYFFNDRLKAELVLEYLYNKQITSKSSTDYPLPFSPPANVFLQLEYRFKDSEKWTNTRFYLNTKAFAKQSRIAQNEEVTSGYQLIGGGVATEFGWNKFKLMMQLSGSNLLNTKAYNHTSFYRALEIPELGRSFQLMIQIPF